MTTLADIQPGDVLLFRGKGLIPWAIRLFDGGEVNHAAIAVDGVNLAEAAGHGLQAAQIAQAVGSNVFTEVRRMDGLAPEHVIEQANSLVKNGNEYAYHQLVLLALLAVTRRIPVPWAAKRLIRSALDHAATALGDLVPTGKTRMICSEFVYRCYAEAAPPSLIDIQLATVFAAALDGEPPLLDWAMQQGDIEVQLPPLTTFGPFDIDAAQAEVEQRIIEYAEDAGLAGTLPEEVVITPTVTFAAPAPQPTNEDLLGSLAAFGLALQDTADGAKAPATFGIGSTIGSAALKGAIKGIIDVSVDANFVTPRDLAKTNSLTTIGRITPS